MTEPAMGPGAPIDSKSRAHNSRPCPDTASSGTFVLDLVLLLLLVPLLVLLLFLLRFGQNVSFLTCLGQAIAGHAVIVLGVAVVVVVVLVLVLFFYFYFFLKRFI